MSSSPEGLQFVQKLLTVISDDLLGDGIRHVEQDEDSPKNVYPAGNLGPASEYASQMNDFRITEYVPSSVGFLFRLSTSASGELKLEGSFNVYAPRMPTLEEVRGHAVKYETEHPYDEKAWSELTEKGDRNFKVKFRPIFRRREVKFRASVELRQLVIDGQYHNVATEPQLKSELKRIADEVGNAETCLRVAGGGHSPSELKLTDILNQESYERCLSKYGAKSVPDWDAGVKYRAWRDVRENCTVVEMLFCNLISASASEEF